MKTISRTVLGLACLLFFSHCQQDDEAQFFRISQGIFFCNCFGECLTTLRVANEEILLQTFETCDPASKVVKSCQDFFPSQDFDALTQLVSWEEFRALEETVGCPDCNSGGGEWIEISRGGEVYRVTYESGSPPEELEELSAALRARIPELLNTAGC